jgi:multicomponent K+:H+ antiporter subunit E
MNHHRPGPRGGWLDHPVLSLLLALTWLALSRSLAPVHLLTAAMLGLLIPRLLRGLLQEGSSVRWGAALRLTGVVLWDIVVSNVTVARLVLGPMGRLKPAWLRVPLASDYPRVNSLFASIITMTPGTVSAVVDEQARCIWVHALDCDDAVAMVAAMKARYEAPLLHVLKKDRGEDR